MGRCLWTNPVINIRYQVTAIDLFLSIDIYTLGGNNFGAPCVFPFKFNDKWFAECIRKTDDASTLWCATTSDFDKDQRFGNCPLKGNLFINISGKALSKMSPPLTVIISSGCESSAGQQTGFWVTWFTGKLCNWKRGLCSSFGFPSWDEETGIYRMYGEGGVWDWLKNAERNVFEAFWGR